MSAPSAKPATSSDSRTLPDVCLIAFAWQVHPAYPLIVAGNRDEFFARPTAPADWWADGRTVAGRDLKAGGTWMGLSRDGRFAALTNVRDPSSVQPEAPSRGALVGRFLDDDRPAETVLDDIASDAHRYNGFNLLAMQWSTDPDRRGMWIASQATVERVDPGLHGLSNARLDTPWPKVDAAIAAARESVSAATSADDLIERLFAMLADRAIAPDERLPRTGVTLPVERALSAAFIRMPGYGTRASTVVLVDRDGDATFVERSCEPDAAVEERRFELAFASAARVT